MVLLGFNIGRSDDGDFGKSLDDIIADRRREQSKALSGKPEPQAKKTTARAAKKTAIADRSVATGRAKRSAAARARRGLAETKKPTAMEVEKEVYRQSRKTANAKKASEKKATKGRVPPNSSLREKNNPKKAASTKNNDPPGSLVGRMPQQKQIKAAIQGMEIAGCPMPAGFQLVMQFAPLPANTKKGKATNAKNTTANNNNNNTKKKNTNNTNKNANAGRKSGGRGRKN